MPIYGFQREIEEVVLDGIPCFEVVDNDGTQLLNPIFGCRVDEGARWGTVYPNKRISGDITIPAKIGDTEVGAIDGFAYGDEITSITFLSNHILIPDQGLFACTNLTMVEGARISVGVQTFAYCKNLISVPVIDDLTIYSFQDCTALSDVRISNSCYHVNPLAFVGCTNLSTIYFFGTEEEWNERYPGGSEEIDNAEIIFHEHSWGDWREVEAPGCVTRGRAERYCSGCGAKEVDSILAVGHRWEDYVIDLPASCETPGSRHRACASGCIEYETLPALGHDYGEWEITLEPTCEKLGKRKGRCAVCGHIQEEDIPTSDHDWGEWYEYKAATCESKGEERRDCSYGHYETRSTEKIDHIPSEWIIDTEATETKNGIRHKECIMCGKLLKAEYYEYITPTHSKYFTFGHLGDGTWEVKRAKMGAMPTKIFVPSTYIKSPVTKIGNNSFFNNIEGWSLETVKLPEGITEIGDYAFSYNWELTNIELPKTLKKLGKVAFQYCVSLKEISFPPSLERIPEYAFACCSSLTRVEFTGQSIDEMAFYGCSKLDIWLKKTVKEVKRHAFGAAPNTTVYCESPFKPEGWDDDWCDDTINVVWGYTGTETGCTEHSWGEFETTTLPTCTAKGVATSTCKVCGITKSKLLNTLGHRWVAANCTAPKTCAICGATEGGAFDHDWDKGVVTIEPTCITEGKITFRCTRCGNSYTTSVETTDHSWGAWEDVHPASCEASGMRERKCTVCGEVETEIIETLGHDWDSEVVVVPPTCGESGYTIHTCNNCGTTRQDSFTEATGMHNWSDWNISIPPDCTGEGQQKCTCADCNAEWVASIPKTEHILGDWIIDKQPTTEEEGSMHQECIVCGVNFGSFPIPKLEDTDKYILTESGEFLTDEEGNKLIIEGE